MVSAIECNICSHLGISRRGGTVEMLANVSGRAICSLVLGNHLAYQCEWGGGDVC